MGLRRCQGTADDTGRDTSRHRNVELTSTAGRRGRSMCRAMMGAASRPSHNAAGEAKVIVGRSWLGPPGHRTTPWRRQAVRRVASSDSSVRMRT